MLVLAVALPGAALGAETGEQAIRPLTPPVEQRIEQLSPGSEQRVEMVNAGDAQNVTGNAPQSPTRQAAGTVAKVVVGVFATVVSCGVMLASLLLI